MLEEVGWQRPNRHRDSVTSTCACWGNAKVAFVCECSFCIDATILSVEFFY